MKNYRIIRLSGLHYSDTVHSFLEKHTEFQYMNYENQLLFLFQNSPVFSDSFSRSFSTLGQETIELVIDFEVIQKQWAKENGVFYSLDNWMFDIMMAQIEVMKPDVVYIQSNSFNIPGIFLKNRQNCTLAEIIKEKFPFIRLIAMFSGYISNADRIRGIDILFAGAPSLMNIYKKMGFNPNLLYHSFDESIINKLDNVEKKYDFTFIGSTRAPESRYWALKQLLKETDIEAWLYEYYEHIECKNLSKRKAALRSVIKCSLNIFNKITPKNQKVPNYLPNRLKNIMLELISEEYVKKEFNFKKIPVQVSLREIFSIRCHEPVMGMDMYNVLHQSKVTFNKHSDLRWGGVGNMRMFEATGVETCLVTDMGDNIRNLFEPDKEIVTYTSIDEAIEKVNYLLEHEDQRREIAAAGQRRTLRNHTALNRCMQIDEILQEQL
jgi:spore maturation protein CgeB